LVAFFVDRFSVERTRVRTYWRSTGGGGRGLWLALVTGALVAALLSLRSGWPGPVEATDINQTRLDTALPVPRGDVAVRATFVPGRDGLSSLELLLVDYGGEADAGTLALSLQDDTGAEVASAAWGNDALAHNQVLLWRVPVQANAAGRTYTLLLRGDEANQVTAWGTELDVMADDSLSVTGVEPLQAQTLRLVTRYRLSPTGALVALMPYASTLTDLVAALAFLVLPGLLLLLLRPGRARWDPAAWFGATLALGMALWPVVWLWLTLIGGRWTRTGLAVVAGLGWLAVLVLLMRRRARAERLRSGRDGRAAWLALAAILLLALAVRLLAVRDLAFPPWVDASRHALITRLMVETGAFPDSYEPLLAVNRTPYHYGFHALAASLSLLLGGPLEELLLLVGQWLNALVPLTIYAAAWLLTRHRGASLLAAFLVALPFFFPAYYATWGRFTQLSGIVVWPMLLALTWRLVLGGRPWRDAWLEVGILAAGIFLIHFRLLLLYLPFAGLVWLFGRGRRTLALAGAGAFGASLVLPRILNLAHTMRGARLASTIPDYNALPVGYIRTGWETAFLVAAGVAVVFSLPAIWRRRPWATWIGVNLVWVGVTWLLLSGRLPGLPDSWLINVNSAYIVLFVPLALLFAVVGRGGLRWSRGWPRTLAHLAAAVFGAWLLMAAVFGARQQMTILNEATILARQPDRGAIAWLSAEAPPDSLVAVSSWRWLGQAWAGTDGGAWVTPLSGLRTTTPPVDYVYDRALLAEVAAFNEAAAARESWATPEAAAWLRERGVTHIFVGVRGGFFDPVELAANPLLREVYAQDGAFVFAVMESAP
jgi:hypothetical protein